MAIWLMFYKFTVCVGDEISNFKYVIMKKAIYGVCFLALVGCTRSVRDEVEIQEIQFKSNVRELEAIARSSFSENDKVRLYIVEREDDETKAALPKAGDINQMTSDGEGELHFDDQGKHYYPEKPIDIYGYCWKEEHDDTGDPTTMPVWVSDDQSTDAARAKSDFLHVKADNAYLASSTPIELEFEHMFVQLQLIISTKTSEMVDLTGISDVKLLDVVTDGIFNVGTGEFIKGNAMNTITMATGVKSVVYIVPQSVDSERRLFHFTVGGEDYYLKTPVGGERFEKGKIYVYTVELNVYPGMGDEEITVKPSIKDWDASEPPRVTEIEKGSFVKVMLTDVSNGVVIKKAELLLSSGDFVRNVKDIEVKGNEMQFIFPRLTIGGTLQLDKAHFYTEGGEEFDYYFTGKILEGNNADEIALPMPSVGDAWAGGIIFVVGKVTGYNDANSSFITNTNGINAYRGRVVSKSSLGKFVWCDNKNISVGATDENDGNVNMEAVKAYIIQKGKDMSFFPAFKVCNDLGTGWYWAAINEIKYIVSHKDELNVNIEQSVCYGSSTENGVDYKCSNVSANNKDIATEVRAVRAY